jgi:hypothetical protein
MPNLQDIKLFDLTCEMAMDARPGDMERWMELIRSGARTLCGGFDLCAAEERLDSNSPKGLGGRFDTLEIMLGAWPLPLILEAMMAADKAKDLGLEGEPLLMSLSFIVTRGGEFDQKKKRPILGTILRNTQAGKGYGLYLTHFARPQES